MFYRFLLYVGLIALASCSQKIEPQTLVVTSHDQETIVCEPSGSSYFKQWAVFPGAEEPVRRVFMDVTLGHPDSINIAHWDYLDHITLRRAGGVNGESLDLEIGRMLTPYGSNFKKDWQWKWRVDVTDFASLLRDSVEVEYMHSGYESKEVGWELTIDFEISIGKPVAELVRYDKVFAGNYAYGDSTKPITESLAPIEMEMHPEAKLGRLRIQHTGHGMDRPRGCSEFCSRWREVVLDGTVIDRRDMWKECADNALYPQGGTWIFDRAYWCPGDLQKADLIDFPITQTSHTLDLELEPYTAQRNVQANESIQSMLFQYKQPNSRHDVAIEEILVPNKSVELNRLNPSCFEPRIVVRNLGSEPVQALDIVYGTEGFDFKTFTWIGELGFYEEQVIVLPGVIDFNFGENVFAVEVSLAGGATDEWDADNSRQAQFVSPKEMPEKMVLTYKSNNAPGDNTIRVINNQQEVVFERTPERSEANMLYSDTLFLSEGKYRLALQDTAHNGLEFWFMPKQGYGYLYLSDLDGKVLHRFESDCGVGEKLDFTTSKTPRIDENVEQELYILHPRMFKSKTELMVNTEKPSDGEIHILADGDLVKTIPFKQVEHKTFDIDFADFEDGRYVVELFVEGESKLKLRVNKTSRSYD
ncbi:peptide-N-glycosidase F-related protein [Sunxiuqinia sp. sy24]|uniref:peptide-N-glycosidase F-related protein n=1 Tax=Sunxiuqinia sp. sy24 TaxID=3461495 RepID=UPI004046117B